MNVDNEWVDDIYRTNPRINLSYPPISPLSLIPHHYHALYTDIEIHVDIFAWTWISDNDMENHGEILISRPYRPPWLPSHPHLSLAQTSSLQCNPEPCRLSCTWSGRCHQMLYKIYYNQFHFYHFSFKLLRLTSLSDLNWEVAEAVQNLG